MTGGVAFSFQIGGREVDPTRMDDPQESAVLRDIVETVVDKTELVVCPEHGEPPRFLCAGESIDALSLQVFGCCQSLVDEVEKRLNRSAT